MSEHLKTSKNQKYYKTVPEPDPYTLLEVNSIVFIADYFIPLLLK
jgi:hypothetical protein